MNEYFSVLQVEQKEEERERNAAPAEESQGTQSFSYYSCPPVMQGLAKFQPCNLPSDVAEYNSTPENGECSQCLIHKEQI